ncbi:MAG: histidine phosphatase family protein [Thermicanus sp.]|nr:histidine phosphatase family protein [Thermicanus sp.]
MWEFSFIRHGQTDWNKEGRFQGTLDIPLNQNGIREAELLADWSREFGWKRVYTSDLKRAVQTAEMVAQRIRVPCIVEPSFRERHFGLLEGMEFKKVVEQYGTGDVRVLERMGLGVESTQFLQRRLVYGVLKVIASLPPQPVAVVSHGGAINAFLSWATHGELGIGVTRLRNTSVTRILTDGDRWKVLSVDELFLDGKEA